MLGASDVEACRWASFGVGPMWAISFLFLVLYKNNFDRSAIHNIEIILENDEQLARAVGAVVKLITKKRKSATLKLPSRQIFINFLLNFFHFIRFDDEKLRGNVRSKNMCGNTLPKK